MATRILIIVLLIALLIGSASVVIPEQFEDAIDSVKEFFERRLAPIEADSLTAIPNQYRAGAGTEIHPDALDAYLQMVADARYYFPAPVLNIVSSYRSSQTQADLWSKALAKYGSEKEARKWVAPPGKSTHMTGKALDFYMGIDNSSENAARQRDLPIYNWLRANASSYGFYPYLAEPWHWEYNPIA